VCVCVAADLNVTYHSIDINDPHIVNVIAGVPTNISCGVYSAQPTIIAEWRWSISLFHTMDISNRFGVVLDNGEMMLTVPREFDHGQTYRCSISNSIRTTRTYGYVRINLIYCECCVGGKEVGGVSVWVKKWVEEKAIGICLRSS